MGKDCEIYYPSTLVVKKKNIAVNVAKGDQATYSQKTNIYLDTNTRFSGIVMVLDESAVKHYIPELKIESNTVVNGEVYCSKNVELKGTVNGMVSTDGFLALENGNIYQNHIYNGTINSNDLSATYVGILLDSREDNKKVMKWLY